MTGPVRRQDGDAPESEAVAILRELVARVNGCSCPCDCNYDDILDRAEALLAAAPETRTGPSEEAELVQLRQENTELKERIDTMQADALDRDWRD